MKIAGLHIRRHHIPHIVAGSFALKLLIGFMAPLLVTSSVSADQLGYRSFKLSDPTTNATNVSYTFGFTTITGGALGSVRLQICTNYIYEPATDTCIRPTGFSAVGAALGDQTGVNDFILSPSSTTGSEPLLTRPVATNVSPQPLTIEITGLTNPSYVGSMYVRIATYASTDGTGPETDYGSAVTSTTESITITTEVPPYLQFCTGITIDNYNCGTAVGDAINFGELSTRSTSTATSQMLASTNADYGYSITLAGTTMMAGNNIIPPLTGDVSRIGVSQFGMNIRANTGPVVGRDPDGPGIVMPKAPYGTPNQYRFVSGDIVASTEHPDDYRKMTVSYIVNRSADQGPGHYVATVSYICLANF